MKSSKFFLFKGNSFVQVNITKIDYDEKKVFYSIDKENKEELTADIKDIYQISFLENDCFVGFKI